MSAAKAKAAPSKAGWLQKFEEAAPGSGSAASWTRYYAVLRGHELALLINEGAKEDEPRELVDIEDALLNSPDAAKTTRRFALDVTTRGGAGTAYHLSADNRDEHESWLQALAVAAVPDAWPGGLDFNRRPQPLLYSMWVVRHTGNAASLRAGAEGEGGTRTGAGARGAADARVPSPFLKLPLLKSAPAWQRKGLLLQKLRQCSIVFDGVDAGRFVEDRESKRNTLLEVVDFADVHGKSALADPRVLEDMFTTVRLNLFRTLPRAPPPSGDPDEEEETFTDPQWAHLNIAYELLLRLVSMDSLDAGLKKRAVDPPFMRALLSLFDSEDARERDYLKTITHRIYSKLTQRRALIRRVICNVFYEFVLETDEHRGIAEMLEILASIINGFAVPIKDEHKAMLVRALIPLHKSRGVSVYHPQLSYCMALYASKDHTLTRDIIPNMLRYWPTASFSKSIMFLNELEDIFEYALEDDVAVFREALAHRLVKCIGGLHFQVCERTLLLWNSARFHALMLQHSAHRPAVLAALFPALYDNHVGHWHESIRTLSGNLLNQYAVAAEGDGDLFARLKAEAEERLDRAQAAAQAAAEAVAAAAAAVVAPTLPLPSGGARLSPSDREAGKAGAGRAVGAAASGESGSAGGTAAGFMPGGAFSGSAAALPAAVPLPQASATSLSPGRVGAGGGVASPSLGGSHGRAPAVRSSTSFTGSDAIDRADILPGHKEGSHATPGKGGRGMHGSPLGLPPLGGGMGVAGEVED